MNIRKIIIVILSLIGALIVSSSAQIVLAEEAKDTKIIEQNTIESPRDVIEEIFSKVRKDKIKKDLGLQKEVSVLIDFKEMAKSVLGKKRKKLSSKQKKWFDSTLEQIITKTVYSKAPEFLDQVKIIYKNEKTQTDKASLLSVVKQKGEITEVQYEMKKKKEHWRVVDVSIDSDSWVEGMREEIEDILTEEKWPGLKKRMTTRLDQLKKTK